MIQKDNLDASLVQWIMSTTGLGPGIGEVFYVAPATSTTSLYKNQLEKMGILQANMFATPTAAYAAMSANRNDIMLVMPGKYTQTESLTWDKAHTHMLGLGGPNQMGHWRTSSEYDKRNVVLNTVTEEVAENINITGENCQFHNIMVVNEGDNAANLAAVKVNKHGCYFKNVHFLGNVKSSQIAEVEAASLYIHTYADYCMFDSCIIGGNTYVGTRTGVASGQLTFSSPDGVTGPSNGMFKDCLFWSRSNTAEVGIIRFSTTVCINRDWIFDNCLFTNHSPNYAVQLAGVFVGTGTHTANVILRNGCTAVECDEWQTMDYLSLIVADMPVVDSGGGLVRVPSTSTFTSTSRNYTT